MIKDPNEQFQEREKVGTFIHCQWKYNVSSHFGKEPSILQKVKPRATIWPSNSNPQYNIIIYNNNIIYIIFIYNIIIIYNNIL